MQYHPFLEQNLQVALGCGCISL